MPRFKWKSIIPIVHTTLKCRTLVSRIKTLGESSVPSAVSSQGSSRFLHSNARSSRTSCLHSGSKTRCSKKKRAKQRTSWKIWPKHCSTKSQTQPRDVTFKSQAIEAATYLVDIWFRMRSDSTLITRTAQCRSKTWCQGQDLEEKLLIIPITVQTTAI